MKVKLLEDFDWKGNDSNYVKNEIIEVEELFGFTQNYARYYQHAKGYTTFDWIPKNICEVVII